VAARLIAVALAGLALAGPVAADIRGFAPPPGMAETHREIRDPDIHAVPMHPVGGREAVTEPRRGRVEWRSFRGPGPATPLGAIEAVAVALAAAGFRTVFDCAARACGGFEFRLAIDVLPQPAMMMNPLDFHQRTLEGTDVGGAPVTVSLLASRFAGVTHLQVVFVTGETAVPTGGDGPPAPVPQPPDPPDPDDAAAMAAQLLRDGHLVLDGLDFASAATEGGLVDAPVLDRAAAMLAGRPDLAVAVVGHSDNVGSLDSNIRLSRDRAAAVVEALVARGVPRERLRAEGVGWLAPRQSNATEAGRGANRRVELVLR
jgi:OOP family OmpA-OmpF porin